jgi:hypothetical protein
MGSGLWPAVKSRVSRKLLMGMGSGLWAAFEQCEQKTRNGQWTLGRLCREG